MIWDSYWGCFLLVISGGLLAVCGLLITRKIINFEKLRSSHDVGGYLLSVVGVLYAVLIGLVIVDAMHEFQEARNVTEREANNLSDIFLFASQLSEPQHSQVQKACVDYANIVINKEWKDMDNGTYSPEARRKAIELIKVLLNFQPKSDIEKALYPQMVSDASQVWGNRRERINIAINGVPGVEWVVLIAGAVITVFFTYFFGLENLWLQIIMTFMVTLLISLNLSLLLLFGYPFSGDLCVHADSFRLDQSIFENHIATIRKSSE